MSGDSPKEIDQKKVDESWKEQVDKERVAAERGQPGPSASSSHRKETPRRDFGFFLSTLSMQAMIALGEVPHPVTQARQEDLEQARYLIDVLGTLQEKTKGNLTPEETELLEGILYELRMKYVTKAKR